MNREHRLLDTVILVVAVCLAHAWCLHLPFQADDYILLRGAPSVIGLEAARMPPPGVAPDLLDNTYMFRPVLWFLWWLEMRLGGGVAYPMLFHAVSVLCKAVAAVLLHRLFRRLGAARAPALVGGLLFAVFPGSSQATSWISAQGDQIAVLLTAALGHVVMDVTTKGFHLSRGLIAAACLFLAFLSKDVALASLPAVALVAFASMPRPRRIPYALLASLAVAIVVALLFRFAVLGTFRPRYLSPVEFELKKLLDIPRLFGHSLAYWNTAPVFAEVAPWVGRGALALTGSIDAARPLLLYTAPFALLVPTLFRGGLLEWRTHFAIAAALAAVLAPPLLLDANSGAHSISRVYEPAAAVMAGWLTFGLHLATRGGERRVPWIALLPLIILVVDFGIHVPRTELMAGQHVQGRLESLRERARTYPKDTRIAIIDREASVGGIPTIYFTVAFASREPFERVPIDTVWWPSTDSLRRFEAWWDYPGFVAVLEAEGDHYVQRRPLLPPRDPNVARALIAPATTLDGVAMSPRDVDAVFAKAEWPNRERVDVEARWTGDHGSATTHGSFLGGQGVIPVAIPIPPDPFATWTSVAVTCRAPLRDLRIGRYPELQILSPKEGDVRAAWPQGKIQFKDEAPRSGWRFLVEIVLDDDLTRPFLVLKATPDRVEKLAGGVMEFDPARATDITVEGLEGGAAALVPAIAARIRASGAARVRAAVRVESIDWWTGMVTARSRWVPFSLTEMVP